ncbi:colanic acid biosynthesis glycosyltransferase WcaI [Polaribacter pacificus]|uniref:Colanic acid biosynthesis glycosyltransferase WcaI n=1 Tax=Polaribacter pacificus TaxID=1775173 RepID=A0A917HXD6_9FLAO|nr:WcaI family glycosyltransferase [Polaribacter pacificus]GGG93686.1 colanic acid biosynthesis glycosyltransferase WcaI [Polaribacter pacificus]
MKKKLTIIGINYYPEDTAIGLYTSQLATYFNNEGVEVSVLTGFPYYPSWKISKSYKNKSWFYKENINGVQVYRYKQYVPQRPTFLRRIFHLLDFTFGTFINLFKIQKADVVLCIVPFTSTIFLGSILAKLKKAKLWIHIQDFEFDAASDSEMTKKKSKTSIFYKVLFRVEKRLLQAADVRSTISHSMLKKLVSKNADKKSVLLPNWVDLSTIDPVLSTRHHYLKSDGFKILYSGNIGEKQDWEFFLQFAKQLEKNKQIELIIVGDGSKRSWLENELIGSKNVTLYPPVPYSELSDLLCSADLHFLFQKGDIIDAVMPSKILGMMASEKPSLITGNLNSEVSTIISESKAGAYFSSSELIKVLDFVSLVERDLSLRKEFGINARKYVSKNFSKDEVLKQFKRVLETI